MAMRPARCGGANPGQAGEMSIEKKSPTDEKDPVVPTIVRELIQESQKIQGWIGKLAEHADAEHEDVFKRVRDDYSGRLGRVADQLADHRSGLLSSLEDRKSTVASLRVDRFSHTADLEEVRLRRAVGEFTEKEWDSRRATIETSLDRVDSLLAVEEKAVYELTIVVDTIGELVPRAPAIAHVMREAAVAPKGTESVYSVAAGGIVTKTTSWSKVLSELPGKAEQNGASDDELAFLETVSPADFNALDPISAALNDE
jgi:hypothetical protein